MRRFVRALASDPWIAVVSAALIAGGLFFGIGAMRDFLRFGSHPLETDVAGALAEGRQWLAVAPGAWRCDRAVQRGVSRFVPAEAQNGGVLVADFQRGDDFRGELDCAAEVDRHVVGVVDEVPEHLRASFEEAGFGRVERLLSVSSVNKKEDSLIGVLFCFVGVPALVPLMLLLRRGAGGLHAWSQGTLDAAALAPADSQNAHGRIRKHGTILLGVGALGLAVSETLLSGTYLWGFVPLGAFFGVVFALGAFELVAPGAFQQLYRRARFRGE